MPLAAIEPEPKMILLGQITVIIVITVAYSNTKPVDEPVVVCVCVG